LENNQIEKLLQKIESLEKRVIQLENRDKKFLWFDEVSQLYWEIKEDKESLITYFEVQKYLESLNLREFQGFNDWRVPTKDELETLFNIKKDNMHITNELLKNMPSKFKPIFWSSTSDLKIKTLKWVAYFDKGYGDFKYKTHRYYFMAVRK